jgi:hypothetical protein
MANHGRKTVSSSFYIHRAFSLMRKMLMLRVNQYEETRKESLENFSTPFSGTPRNEIANTLPINKMFNFCQANHFLSCELGQADYSRALFCVLQNKPEGVFFFSSIPFTILHAVTQ